MNWLNIYPARIRSIRIESKSELIALVVCIVLYFVLNLLLQKFCPNMKQKTINIISLIPAVIAAFIIIFTVE
ncbi:hypothetical protein [Porcipelethomonas sp.]|uniref:hypothetical protein n=1 Tax=Porcipelethomonas sp. TaxID=2981675 RepID=UPI003EF4B99A